MKAPLRMVLLSLSVLVLSSCASTQEGSAYVEPTRVSNPGEVDIRQDSAYIARVEQIARRRGIVVQWVHPPTKRVGAQQ